MYFAIPMKLIIKIGDQGYTAILTGSDLDSHSELNHSPRVNSSDLSQQNSCFIHAVGV